MNARRYISVQRHGSVVQAFYFDIDNRSCACLGVTDDYGVFVKTDPIYGEVDTDVDDDALEAMWPRRHLESAGMVDPQPDAATAPPVPVSTTQPKPPALDWLSYQRLKRKLDAWELDHLRAHAAEQAETIEQLQDQLTVARARADQAEDSAEFWRDAHHSLADHLDDGTADARCIGLTKSGALLVVQTGAPS